MITRQTFIIVGGIVLIVLLTALGIILGQRFQFSASLPSVSLEKQFPVLIQNKVSDASLQEMNINPQDWESLQDLESLNQDLDEMEQLLNDSTLSDIEKDLEEFEF